MAAFLATGWGANVGEGELLGWVKPRERDGLSSMRSPGNQPPAFYCTLFLGRQEPGHLAASSSPRSSEEPDRVCPRFPQCGHKPMCPHCPYSSTTHTLYRGSQPDAYDISVLGGTCTVSRTYQGYRQSTPSGAFAARLNAVSILASR